MPIGDLLELQRRDVDVRPNRDYQEIGVRSFGKGLFIKPPVLGAELGNKRVFAIRRGDFVVSNVFAWEGAVGVATKEHDGLIGSHRFMTWTPRGDVNVEYLRHYFGSEAGVDSLASASPGSAGRNRTLSIKNFEQILVPVPPLREQDRIVDRLASLDTAINAVPSTKVSLHSRLPVFLGGALRSTTRSTTLMRDLATNQQVVVHPGDDLRGATEFVGLEHIETHTGRRTGSRPIGNETGRKLLFIPGQVTYGYLRPYLNKAWAADRKGLCSVEQFTLTPNPGVDPRVLSVVLRSDPVWLAAQNATNSLQLPRLSLGDLMSFEVPDVRGLAWDSIGPEVERVTEMIVHEAKLRSRRQHLHDSILPAARNAVFDSMR